MIRRRPIDRDRQVRNAMLRVAGYHGELEVEFEMHSRRFDSRRDGPPIHRRARTGVVVSGKGDA